MDELKLPDVEFSPHINIVISDDDAAADKLIETLRAINRSASKTANWISDCRKIAVAPWDAKAVVDEYITDAYKDVPVFYFTNDYFVLNYFALAAEYGDAYKQGAGDIQFLFISYYNSEWQSASLLHELEYNPVGEEFDRLYELEQNLIYGDNRDGDNDNAG